MKWKEKKPVLFMLIFSGIILFLFLLMQPAEILYIGKNIAILYAKGIIAIKERNLLFIIQAIMLLVVIPVYILTFIFSWKYRAHNPKGKYDPNLEDNVIAEYIWWGLPFVLTLIIAILTYVKTYELDPYKPLIADKKEKTIQVVALQWKWLFIYPDEKIATVNFLQIPEKTPIKFEITSDAPMNSFWIPQLGGQIYAMPKMQTKLYLMADEIGEYRGYSANLSGDGFSRMHFLVRASSDEEFQEWVDKEKNAQNTLNLDEYNKLSTPKDYYETGSYVLAEENLFEKIIMKYMHPQR